MSASAEVTGTRIYDKGSGGDVTSHSTQRKAFCAIVRFVKAHDYATASASCGI